MVRYHVFAVVLILCGMVSVGYTEVPDMVFDLFADCEDDQFDVGALGTAPILSSTANVVLVLINWNGPIGAKTEHSLWKAATHPNIVAQMTIQVSSSHRAKNSALHEILKATEHQMTLPGEDEGVFSHILLVNQDISFEMSDIDKLILADKEIIGGVTPSRSVANFPSFIPAANKEFLSTRSATIEELYDHVLSKGGPFPVRASSSDFLLIKIASLKTIRKHFGDYNEWFWLSEKTPLWAVGNCYDILTEPVTKTPSKESLSVFESQKYSSLLKSLHSTILEEDLCFSKNLNRFGYSIYVHPLVNPTSTRTIDISYSGSIASLSQYPRNSNEEATVIENRNVLAASGRPLAMDRPRGIYSIVLATAIWESFYPKTSAGLFRISSNSDIIGRVSIDHTEIIEARNKLVRKVEEEFPNYTHILFVDGDMVFTSEDLDVLVNGVSGIAFGLAVKRMSDKAPPAYLPLSGDPGDHKPLLKALEQNPAPSIPVKGAGMAFSLIRRNVFDAVARDSPTHPGMKEWFWTEHVIDEDSHREQHLSEDYCFCRRAREAGFDVRLFPSVILGHIDEIPITIKEWLSVSGIKFNAK